jgi:hypothetical protein
MYRMLIGSGMGVGVSVRAMVGVRTGVVVIVLVAVLVKVGSVGADLGVGSADGIQPASKINASTDKVRCLILFSYCDNVLARKGIIADG